MQTKIRRCAVLPRNGSNSLSQRAVACHWPRESGRCRQVCCGRCRQVCCCRRLPQCRNPRTRPEPRQPGLASEHQLLPRGPHALPARPHVLVAPCIPLAHMHHCHHENGDEEEQRTCPVDSEVDRGCSRDGGGTERRDHRPGDNARIERRMIRMQKGAAGGHISSRTEIVERLRPYNCVREMRHGCRGRFQRISSGTVAP